MHIPLNWDWPHILLAAAVIVAAYLVGSLSAAYLLTRRLRGQDIRTLGDGNAGAENVARVLGLKAGVIVAVLDIGKGLAVAVAARLLTPYETGTLPLYPLLAGAAAVIGHSWPVYLKGTGGRGAATAAGALLALAPLMALAVLLPSLAVLAITRSATWCLASFFIGVVVPTGVLAGLGVAGYSWATVGYVVTLPALVAAIHFLSRRRARPKPD